MSPRKSPSRSAPVTQEQEAEVTKHLALTGNAFYHLLVDRAGRVEVRVLNPYDVTVRGHAVPPPVTAPTDRELEYWESLGASSMAACQNVELVTKVPSIAEVIETLGEATARLVAEVRRLRGT